MDKNQPANAGNKGLIPGPWAFLVAQTVKNMSAMQMNRDTEEVFLSLRASNSLDRRMQSPQSSQMAIKLQPRACASCLKGGSQILTCDTLLMSHPSSMNASALSGLSRARAGGWR